MRLYPAHLKDFYKTDHLRQYPKKTSVVNSNMTGRGSRIAGVDKYMTAGIQGFAKDFLVEVWERDFFSRPKAEVLQRYKRRLDNALGKDSVGVQHIADLHDLGYLPIELKALPEGTLVPMRIPCMTIVNTKPEYYWLTNFLETLISVETWHPMTTATIAFQFRKMFHHYAKKTSDMEWFVPWQGHDFSMRGHTSVQSAIKSGAAHLLCFTGTDTIPAIDYLEDYYNADSDKEIIGGSIPATEHSVMCMGGEETEEQTFHRLISEVYPSGPVSIVSDTWDYWHVMTEVAMSLRDKIMSRPGNLVMPTGKVVFRPDSGKPVLIVCGTIDEAIEINKHIKASAEEKGTIECLWDIFGGTKNSKSYHQLDPHVGCIYGDSITMEIGGEILHRLEKRKLASTNMVFGIGSYTYQYVTRDTLGFAMKATYGVIDGKPVNICKNPKTDNGVKKSAKGLLRVNADLTLTEECTPEEEKQGLLQTVFKDGKIVRDEKLVDIRARVEAYLK